MMNLSCSHSTCTAIHHYPPFISSYLFNNKSLRCINQFSPKLDHFFKLYSPCIIGLGDNTSGKRLAAIIKNYYMGETSMGIGASRDELARDGLALGGMAGPGMR